jgi:hypothetical protein
VLAGLAFAGVALANDSAAEMAAGGLVLRQSRDIDMVSEDLYVSANEIRVRYVFRNRATRDVRTTVAFPMPDLDLAAEGEGDVSWPGEFRTSVDGSPVRMAVERRAFLGGVDHSALLASVGVRLTGHEDTASMYQAVESLPAAARDRLAQAGLVRIWDEGATRHADPLWTVRETWHWDQTFPAGRDLVVEHRYRPGAGGTVSTALASAEVRASEYGREQIARYCIDQPFLRAVDRLAARSPAEFVNVGEQWVSYILTTGGNWRSPIGDFRLVVDKGRPDNLVSFCGEGVRRISPTQFELRRRNWRPDRDLHVLILTPFRANE